MFKISHLNYIGTSNVGILIVAKIDHFKRSSQLILMNSFGQSNKNNIKHIKKIVIGHDNYFSLFCQTNI